MSYDIQLEDLLSEYPRVEDPALIPKLTSKYEFIELESNLEEPPPEENKFYKHQYLILRLVLEYSRILILHGTGAGKSYLIGLIGEAFRRLYLGDKAELDSAGTKIISPPRVGHVGRGIRRMLVVVSNKLQKANIKQMLICKSTGGRYLIPKILHGKTEKGVKGIATRLVRDFYEIVTYDGLAKKLNTMSNEQIADAYEGYAMFFDEIHNLRVDPTKDILMIENPTGKQLKYRNIWRLTHWAKNSKVIGSTASLAVDNVSEAKHVLNIISADGSSQLTVNDNLETISLEELSHKIPIISFLRSFNVGAKPVVMGEQIGDSGLTLNLLPMAVSTGPDEGYQQGDIYRKIAEDTIKSLDLEKELERMRNLDESDKSYQDSIYTLIRYASNGIFPDGTTGNMKEGGFHKYFKRKGNWYEIIDESIVPAMRNLRTIAQLSIKNYFLVDLCKEKANKPGVIVIFCEQVTGAGVIYAAMTLEQHGFERFNENEDIFVSSGKGFSYCKQSNKVNPFFEKKNRYIYIHSDTPNLQNVLTILTSSENIDGDYIKVVFISKVSSEAISIHHATTYVQYQAVWTPTVENQAKDRIYRSQSHLDLQAREIDRLIDEGMDPDEARRIATVDVEEYYLASIYPGENVSFITSIDYNIYNKSLGKDIAIKGFIRKLAKISVDCPIHRKRNIRADDVDNSPECHYQECNYQCFYKPRVEVDFSTYDINFTQEAVDKIQNNLKIYFLREGSGTIDSIRSYLDPDGDRQIDFRSRSVEIALSKMIIDRIPIRDRFGYVCYLLENDGVFFLTRSYPLHSDLGSNLDTAYYATNIIMNNSTSFSVMVSRASKSKMEEKEALFSNIDPNLPNYEEIMHNNISSLPADEKAILLESAVKEYVEGHDSKYIETVAKILSHSFYPLHEMVTEIEKYKKGFRYKSKDFSQGPDFVMDMNTDVVYVHVLYTRETNLTEYHVTTSLLKATGRIRIYRPSQEKDWRDADQYETPVYQRFAQYYIYRLINSIITPQNPYAGIIIEGKFKIINRTRTAGKHPERSKGRVCTTWDKIVLVDILYFYMPEANNYNMSKENLTNNIMGNQNMINNAVDIMRKNKREPQFDPNWSQSEINDFWYMLAYYYSYLSDSGITRKYLCDIIRQYMTSHQLIFTF